MKAIYLYDTTSREFKGSKTIDDDNYVAQAGETEIKPTDGLYEPVTWNGSTWVGTDKEVWQAAQDAEQAELLKEHPELAPQPTAEQQMINALGLQIVSLQATVTKLTTANGGAA